MKAEKTSCEDKLIDSLTARLNLDFSGPYMKVHQDLIVSGEDETGQVQQQRGRVFIVANIDEGYKHRAFVFPQLGAPLWKYLVSGGLEKHISELEARLTIKWGNPNQNPNDFEDLGESAFSSKIFAYTDELSFPRAEFFASLRRRSLTGRLVDDLDWKKRELERVPDLFISHDFRDKDTYVDALYEALVRRLLKVWYDNYSLRPGDRLAESIDRGLSECRHAVVVLSRNMLENDGWARSEISGLLNRGVRENNLIIPIWLDVDVDEVSKRSRLLADIVALKASDGVEAVADKICSVVVQGR